MINHKSKAGTKKCLCETCDQRFQCFTQEKIFSDDNLQGMFEALMAQGLGREAALIQIVEHLKDNLNPSTPAWNIPYTYSDGGSSWATTSNPTYDTTTITTTGPYTYTSADGTL